MGREVLKTTGIYDSEQSTTGKFELIDDSAAGDGCGVHTTPHIWPHSVLILTLDAMGFGAGLIWC
jgi:hypothetical protein